MTTTSPPRLAAWIGILAILLAALMHHAAAWSRGGAAPPEGRPTHAERGAREAVVARVVDGDTFVLRDGARVRVADFDTPELRRARCDAERRLARAATVAARRLLLGRRITIVERGRDRWGRIVADVSLLGAGPPQDLRAAMRNAGHGAYWDYGRAPKPTWCGGGGR